ncbi:MAG: phosphoglycerate kinase [Firmicutes bacterium]|nr:phosphoglycerate kinase [Bacillota bacterium]
MYKTLKNTDLKDKKVVLRCDFNVPIKDGIILDDSKIRESLETINYLIEQNCKIVILSHFGKVKTKEDKVINSLEPVYIRLKELLKRDIYFSHETRAVNLYLQVDALLPKDILLLENTRFEDLNGNLESGCDPQLSMYWASLCDVFVMDAFASAHRKHASTYGISKYVPSCIGFLVEKELNSLKKYIIEGAKPLTVVMGGAKIEDKIELIESFLNKCDYLLLTGGIANTFLKVLNINIGESLASKNPTILEKVKELLLNYREKIMLPLDVIVATTYDKSYIKYKHLNELDSDDIIVDCGNKTIEKYKTAVLNSKTVFVNGTMGIYEDERFSNGTKEFLRMLKESECTLVAGGGDSVSAINIFGYADSFTYLSSGGGATLKFLTDENLPGLSGIDEE